MPKPATAHIDDAELKMKKLAAPEEMERRRLIAVQLHALMGRSMTEAEKEFWQEFDAGLEKDRLAFR
jgi:hypothetical protein